MDGKRAREITKNIYDEDIDVEDKLTAMQDNTQCILYQVWGIY